MVISSPFANVPVLVDQTSDPIDMDDEADENVYQSEIWIYLLG